MTHDPLANLLQPLRDRTWTAPAHRTALLAQLESERHWPARRSRAKTAAMCAALVVVFAAAIGAAPFVLRLFALEIVDVERDADGKVERLTLKTDDDRRIELVPLRRDRDFDRPVLVVVPQKGGGELSLHVLRDVDLDLLPQYVQVDGGAASETQPGERFAVRAVPCPWRVTLEAERLVLEGDGGRRIELPRIATAAGSLPRYGDERGLVEVLDR